MTMNNMLDLPLGRRLRLMRARSGLTIDELARIAGVSRTWVGRIERGTARPSVVIVEQLARALRVSTSVLLGDVEGDGWPVVAEAASVVRREERRALRFPQSDHFFQILTPDLNGSIGLMLVEIEPEEQDESIGYFQHSGEEVFFVVDGCVTLEVDGNLTTLNSGDSARIDSSRRHRLINHTPNQCVVLSASTPPFL